MPRLSWGPDSEERQRSFMRGVLFVVIGLLVGITFSFGVSGVSQYSSVSIECLPNGTYEVVQTSETVGLVMLLSSLFILALAPLVYCQLKREYEVRNDGL